MHDSSATDNVRRPDRHSPSPRGSLRGSYRDFRSITTRWADNDVFGHVNNATYYSYLDTTVTGWLHARGLIAFAAGPMWVVVETGCRYFAEAAFPDTLSIGARIARIGTSSARWQLGVFRNDEPAACAEGHLIHVFVDRATRRPAPIPADIRSQLAPLLTTGD